LRPDVLSIQTSFIASSERGRVLPADVKGFMKIPSILGVDVLPEETCVALEIRALVNIKLGGRLALKSMEAYGV
jgi:hypothetical protein